MAMRTVLSSMLTSRGIYSDIPPDVETRDSNNPTLLMSWWATGFSLAIIVTRVCGRYIRVERFFPEDKLMMASAIPLLARMAFVHVVLLWGTNNTKIPGEMTEEEVRHREIASRLVLCARVFYAVFIWTAKFTVCEFLKRVSGMIWRRSFRIFLSFIYVFLASTFAAVVIATLAECQPFDHYWQVIPDPGPKCRSGYAHLITMGACDVMTDLLLVAFPIPIILMTSMSLKRKISLVVLFALSLILVAITCYRVPSVIHHDGSQQYRSLLASLEILAATAVSNAVVIGSFVRDRGVKKAKFKKAMGSASVSESMDHSSLARATITYHQWGSDSDLAGDLGIRLDPKLHSTEMITRPAPIAYPYRPLAARTGMLDPNWSFKQPPPSDDGTSTSESYDMRISPREYIETNETAHENSRNSIISRRRKTSIFDVGGLLDPTPSPGSTYPNPNTEPPTLPQPDLELGRRQPQRYRKGSRAFLQDVGGLLSSSRDSHSLRSPRTPQSPNFSRPGAYTSGGLSRSCSVQGSDCESSDPLVPPYRTEPDVFGPVILNEAMELRDVGGLLSRGP